MAINLQEEYNKTNIQGIIDQLEEDLVGLAPVKQRIREIAALLLVQRLRKNLNLGMNASSVGLHMSFTGSPGTGKTEVATRMADILFKLGYIRKGHLITVTRDDSSRSIYWSYSAQDKGSVKAGNGWCFIY